MSKVKMGIQYRKLRKSDSIDELSALINRAYNVYNDMGLDFMGSSQNAEKTKKRIKKAVCIIALDNDRIVGTISLKPTWKTRGSEWFNRKDVAKFNQLAVDPNMQKKGIAAELIDLSEKLAWKTGAGELAMDTSEQATELIEYYKKKGFRFIEFLNWEFTNYRSVVLSRKIL